MRILTEKVDELLGQTLLDADSIKSLNAKIRDLRQEHVEKALKILRLEASVDGQKAAMKKQDERIAEQQVAMKKQDERIAGLEKALDDLRSSFAGKSWRDSDIILQRVSLDFCFWNVYFICVIVQICLNRRIE